MIGAARPRRQPDQPVLPAQRKTRALVMVVDDSITMRKVTSRVLENHSLEVMTAQDGLDAIRSLHERIPDLMLLDIEMPRMDGYELAEHVRADARLRHIPIVMITSRAGQKHRKKARDAGANAYLTKPYQEAELVAQVGEMLKLDLQPRRND
jgi:chemosensory pili system protein ChpA (sensor histidine kinase/response regulator)